MKVLLAFGEHDAVDLRVGFVAGERNVLIYFRQTAAKRARIVHCSLPLAPTSAF